MVRASSSRAFGVTMRNLLWLNQDQKDRLIGRTKGGMNTKRHTVADAVW